MISSHFRLALLGCVMALTAACEHEPVAPAQEQAQGNQGPFPFIQLAPSAPPQIIFETKYPPSRPMEEMWRPGYWQYDGTQFHWVPGSYILRPHPTASWEPDRWEKHTYGWAYVPGHWK